MFARIIFSGAAVLAIAIGVFTAGDALAGRGGGGKLDTTISFSPQTLVGASTTEAGVSMVHGDVDFMVTRSIPYDKNTIWVTNKCWDADGNVVVDQDAAVLWGTTTSLVGVTGDMPTDGATCTAYTTLRPWKDRPMDEPLNYDVGG